METDFIVIGSGVAGLTSALTLASFGKVLLVSKGGLRDCATSLAQGGIAAVVAKDDSFSSHINDTLEAGCFHNNKEAVELLVRNGPKAINWLIEQGVEFDKKGRFFSLGQEAAHSFPRILHATDFTGRVIEEALVAKVKETANICCWTNSFALDLLVAQERCHGVQLLRANQIVNCFAKATVLATGGLGQIYFWTTNPAASTGDGLAMAYRAGARLSDLEFIQFHPTALKFGKSPLFLLSEAIRGEGGYLINAKGERFMTKIDSRAELAPRDIVARAIFEENKKGDVFLDVGHLGRKFLRKRFPNIYLELEKRGFDMATDKLPVTPAAHYSCGGVKTDLLARTNIRGLFAVGEVACTGVHGANRLASNSLLEAVVFARQLKKIAGELKTSSKPPNFKLINLSLELNDDKFAVDLMGKLKKLMWEKVGIVRNKNDLQKAKIKIEKWEKEIGQIDQLSLSIFQLKNMLLVAKLIINACLARSKSLGCHFLG